MILRLVRYLHSDKEAYKGQLKDMADGIRMQSFCPVNIYRVEGHIEVCIQLGILGDVCGIQRSSVC